MTAYERLLELAGDLVKRHGAAQSDLLCPAHDDHTPSLSVGVRAIGEPGAVVKCQAGCRTEDVLAEWPGGPLPMAALYDGWWDLSRAAGGALETYLYTDEHGAPLFEVGRFDAKRFLQRRPGRDDWKGGIKGVRRVLYRLPNVVEAVRDGVTVYVVEGEKDVHALERAGVVATTSPMGAGKWRDEYAQTLAGAVVIVVQDRDDPGRQHARQVVGSLRGHAASVRLVEAAEGKDAADHLAAGRTVGEFVECDASPAAEPAAGSNKSGGFDWASRIINLEQLLSKPPKPIRYPVDPLVARGFVTTLAGAADVGKSLTAMALAVAAGQKRTELAGLTLNGGRCVLLDAENGAMLMHHRLYAAAAGAGDLILVNSLGLHVVDDQQHFKQLLGDLKADWAILDSLRRHTPGMDENDSGDMTAAYNALAELSRDLDVGLLVIHHASPKSIHAYRGSTAIRDQTDALFALEHIKDDPEPKRLRLQADKYRWAEHPRTFWLRIGRDDEDRLTLLEADAFEGAATERDSEPTALHLLLTARGVWNQLGGDWWGRGALAALLGVPTNQGTFQDMLELALATGELVHNGRQTRAARYRISSNGHHAEGQEQWAI